jgi:hypothetical protein
MSETSAPASRVRGLTCPDCGGTLDVEAGLRVVVCPFCETPLLAVGGVGIRRWAVEPKIDVGEARQAAMKWLTSGWNRDRRLRRESQQGEALLCFLPFFRVQSECVGFALGTEERRRHSGSGKHRRVETYEVDVERSVEKSFDRTYVALNVAEWGVKKVDLRGDRLVPFRPRSLDRLGMVFPPTGSEAEVRAAALEQLKREADPSRGLKTVRFRFLETLRERFSLIYYPLWVIRYRFQGRSYQVLMDGEDGSLVFGKAPGNDLYRAVAMVGPQAVALFVATTILQMVGVSFGGLAAMGAAVLAVFYWGWRRFRHGSVVIEGSGVEADSSFRELLSGTSLRQAVGDFLEGPSSWGARS